MAYGYRYGEVVLPPIGPIKPTRFTRGGKTPSLRTVAQVGTNYVVDGLAMPHPDPRHELTAKAGVLKRFANLPPEIDDSLFEELCCFVDEFIAANFKPLDPSSDATFNTWIEKTKYPRWRKDQLRKVWEDIDSDQMRTSAGECESFIKWESYPEYKHARPINSRDDEFKVRTGPIFKLIEEEVFKLGAFIKKIPVEDRPGYISERLKVDGNYYVGTDYSSFEASFIERILRAVEFRLYRFMIKALPGRHDFEAQIEQMVTNGVCKYGTFRAWVLGGRRSGDMCTSLGNGFTNLVVMEFLCSKYKCGPVLGVVEGDDGLFSFSKVHPPVEAFEKLGFRIKLERHAELETASFCGLIFDSQDLVNICDPTEALACFGWISPLYLRSKKSKIDSIMRAKALSYAVQYKGCPIVGSLAHCAMRHTRFADLRVALRSRALSMWEREQILHALECRKWDFKEPPMNTRLLMERVFGVPVSVQLYIEKELDAYDGAGPFIRLDHGLFSIHKDWSEYWTKYVCRFVGQLPHEFRFGGQPVGFVVEWQTDELGHVYLQPG